MKAHSHLENKKASCSVSASIISCWITLVLKQAGVDTFKFGAHSTRTAFPSAAKQAGVLIMDILSTGNRLKKKTELSLKRTDNIWL